MHFFNRQRSVSIQPSRFEGFVESLAQAISRNANDFSVTLVSDGAMRALNHRYRGKDKATDVLSFPTGKSEWPSRMPVEESPLLGEIAISVETARRQARREGHGLGTEIKLLIIHGVLHLLGYDHETDHGEMNRKEYALRSRLL